MHEPVDGAHPQLTLAAYSQAGHLIFSDTANHVQLITGSEGGRIKVKKSTILGAYPDMPLLVLLQCTHVVRGKLAALHGEVTDGACTVRFGDQDGDAAVRPEPKMPVPGLGHGPDLLVHQMIVFGEGPEPVPFVDLQAGIMGTDEHVALAVPGNTSHPLAVCAIVRVEPPDAVFFDARQTVVPSAHPDPPLLVLPEAEHEIAGQRRGDVIGGDLSGLGLHVDGSRALSPYP